MVIPINLYFITSFSIVLVYGPAVIEHSLLVGGIVANARLGHEFSVSDDMAKLLAAIQEAERLMIEASSGTCKVTLSLCSIY